MGFNESATDGISQGKPKRFNKGFAALSILVALAVVYTLSSLSSYVAPPWPLNVTVENSLSEAYSDTGGAIVDDSYSRLLILNSDGQVNYEFESDRLSSPTTFYRNVAVDDSGVYVAEFTCIDNTDYVGTESLVKYDFEGKRIGTLLELSHDLDVNRCVLPAMQSIAVTQDACFVTLVDFVGNSISVEKVSLTPGSDAANKSFTVLEGALPDNCGIASAAYVPDEDAVIAESSFGNKYVKQRSDASFAPLDDQEGSQQLYDVVHASAVIGSGSALEGHAIGLSPQLMARSLLFWLCVAFLFVTMLTLIVRSLVRCVREKSLKTAKIGCICVLAIALAGGVVVYYSYSVIQAKASDGVSSLSASAALAANYGEEQFAAASDEFVTTGTLSVERYNKVFNKLESGQAALAKDDIGVQYYYVAPDVQGNAAYLASSNCSRLVGDPVTFYSDGTGNAVSFEDLAKNAPVDTATENQGMYVAFAAVHDAAGDTVGLVCTTRLALSHNALVTSNVISLFVALLDVLVALSFLILEGREWVACFAERKQLRAANAARPEIAIGRPLNYLVMGALAVDGALLPLIVQDMLAGTALASNGLVIAIPPLAYTVGLLAGVPLQVWLSNRMPARRYLLICSALAAAFFAACAFSVMVASIPLLTLFIFLSHACIQVVASYVSTLPLHAKDSASRSKMNRSYSAANVSATALSTLIAGQVADSLGDPFVFVVGAMFALLAFVFVVLFIRGGAADETERVAQEAHGAKKTRAWSVLRDPHILVLLLCVVMCGSMATGYKSYIFPLLAADEGLSKAVISSISVYCNALVFYINPALSRVESKVGARSVLILSAGSLAAGLILFFVNSSLSWAIVMLVLAFIAGKSIEPAFSTFWQDRIVETGVPKDVAFPTIMLSYNGLCLLRNPLLGAVMNVTGIVLLSPVVGIYCAANAAVFALVTKKRSPGKDAKLQRGARAEASDC